MECDNEDELSDVDQLFGDFVPEKHSFPVKSHNEKQASSGPNHSSLALTSNKDYKAPTMTIEPVHVGRPQKVLAFLSNFVAFLFFLMSTMSTAWMHTRGTRMGLFQECVKLNDSWVMAEFKRLHLPIPKDACEMTSCLSSLMRICGALNLFCLFCAAITMVLMAYGMLTVMIPRKFITYNVVIGLNCVSMLVMTSNIVMYPIFYYIQFEFEAEEKHEHPHGRNLQIGWSLMVAAAGVVLLALQTILVALDRTGEEVRYRECINRYEEEDEAELL